LLYSILQETRGSKGSAHWLASVFEQHCYQIDMCYNVIKQNSDQKLGMMSRLLLVLLACCWPKGTRKTTEERICETDGKLF